MQFGCRLFPARFLFSAFLRGLAQSSRAISLVIVVFRLVVHFHVHRGPAQPALGRPQDRFSAACSCASCSCASRCWGLHVRRAWRSLFFVFIPSHTCRPSGQPFFSSGFRVFPTATRKCVCVCVCVCVCFINSLSYSDRKEILYEN